MLSSHVVFVAHPNTAHQSPRVRVECISVTRVVILYVQATKHFNRLPQCYAGRVPLDFIEPGLGWGGFRLICLIVTVGMLSSSAARLAGTRHHYSSCGPTLSHHAWMTEYIHFNSNRRPHILRIISVYISLPMIYYLCHLHLCYMG